MADEIKGAAIHGVFEAPIDDTDTPGHNPDDEGKGEGTQAGQQAKNGGNPAGQQQVQGELPDWLKDTNLSDEERRDLSKFKSPADMAKSYREMVRKQSQGGKKPQADAPTNDDQDGKLKIDKPKQPEGQQTQETQAISIVEKAGLKMDDLTATLQEHGDLTEEQYAALSKVGVNKELVQSYVKGQGAQAQLAQSQQVQIKSEAVALTGGEEKLGQLFDWARANLNQPEIDALNTQLSNQATWKNALLGLQSQRKMALGAAGENAIISGVKGGASSAQPFRSSIEIAKAMSDPRYANDSAYRKDVEARMAVTPDTAMYVE